MSAPRVVHATESEDGGPIPPAGVSRMPAPIVSCPICRRSLMQPQDSGPAGYRLRCDWCLVIIVIPRAQLVAVARRLDPSRRAGLGWPSRKP